MGTILSNLQGCFERYIRKSKFNIKRKLAAYIKKDSKSLFARTRSKQQIIETS